MSSLQKIITGSIAGTTPVSWSSKLRIALIMASSLLQLQGTPWLSEDWSKEEIGVLRGVEGEIHTKMLISKSCGSLPQQLRSSPTVNGPRSWEGIRSRPLFTLGVLLIELCIGKPFEELRRQRICSTPSDCQESTFLNLTVADEYIDWCYQDRGPHYGDVVRRCIWCSFDTRNVNFDDAQFQQAVYHGVVAPLQEDVKNFASLSI
ncbi:hypothetical protein MPH_01949 [Macrophomina phaseolina MS6]|uniref:DUF7580 domain-containing protein n=1 Tax=Macrophomina phaseolina (strain MS6) TaxID=1126212 RepID=K2S795_MACPH|nr:hypothetical protein MPH_01949 [Macrophomina phaseolina MS6]